MRYLSVFKSTKTRFGVQKRRGHRDAKLARSVQKKARRATISISIAAYRCGERPARALHRCGYFSLGERNTDRARRAQTSATVQLGHKESGQQSARDASRRGI